MCALKFNFSVHDNFEASQHFINNIPWKKHHCQRKRGPYEHVMITRWCLMRCSRPIIRRTATSRRWVDVKPRRDGGSHATKIGRSLPILRFAASFPTVIEASPFQRPIYGCPTLSRELRFSPMMVGFSIHPFLSFSVGDLHCLTFNLSKQLIGVGIVLNTHKQYIFIFSHREFEVSINCLS